MDIGLGRIAAMRCEDVSTWWGELGDDVCGNGLSPQHVCTYIAVIGKTADLELAVCGARLSTAGRWLRDRGRTQSGRGHSLGMTNPSRYGDG